MEYRRRRRRSRMRNGRSFEAGRALVALIMIGAIVYLISASAAGTWLAENVMAPVFAYFDGRSSSGTEDSPTDPGASTANGSTAGTVDLVTSSSKNTVSDDITLPSLSCYMLQMGVFSSLQNANAEAETLQARGAGGYIIQDGDRYRVIAAGYDDEEGAKSVKTRLIGEGLDCTIYTAQTASATFRVTADKAAIDDIRAGFEALAAAEAAMSDAVIAYDSDPEDIDAGIASVKKILETLDSAMLPLVSLKSANAILTALLHTYDIVSDNLAALTGGAYVNAVDFSAEMKYAHLSMAHEYIKLMAAIA